MYTATCEALATVGLTPHDALQLCGSAVVSWLGVHAITRGDFRRRPTDNPPRERARGRRHNP